MISVLVADDSALVRRLVARALADAPDITVVDTAHHGAQALEKIARLQPDLVTLDIEMPVMDGLTAMREIHRRFPQLPVIMVSTLTADGAAVTLDALAAGARDYVTKPTNTGSLANSLDGLRDQLVPRIRALTTHRAIPALRHTIADPVAESPLPAAHPARRTRSARATQIIAIGSSTGGPDALAQVLGSLAERPSVPIVAVQHMPPVFTTMLAQRLERLGPTSVVEAEDGQPLSPGTVYLAPGGRHLTVQRRGAGGVARVGDGEPENYCKPSVDVLFRSVAQTYHGSAIAVVLTGMGHDGRAGCEQLAADGALVVAQDQESSVVWGMPGAVAAAGLADATIALDRMGPFLSRQLQAGAVGVA